MNKMSEVDDVISRLTAKQQNYLNSYFTYAPESLKSSIQVVRMPAGTTFIQEGAPLDKVFKGKRIRGRLPCAGNGVRLLPF